MSTTHTVPFSAERARELIAARAGERGALMTLLHDLQHEFGYIDRAAIPMLAQALNLSQAEVHGVMTFYTDFRSSPPAPRHVLLCRAEACQARGADALVEQARLRLAVGAGGGTSTDGTITYDEVFCLGNCALGPAALVNGRPVGKLDADRLETILSGGEL